MKKYIEKVISIIDEKGNEYSVSINEKYHKHVQAFKKIEADNEIFNLNDYIKYKGTENITGYELASYLSANGNIVFFHTDVSNWKTNKKEGSILIPYKLNKIQIEKILELIENLKKEQFSFYINQAKFKNNKSYKVIHTPINVAFFLKESYNKINNIESRKINAKSRK